MDPVGGSVDLVKDQILKNYSLEAMEADMEQLKKMVLDKDKEVRKRLSYPTIVIPKPDPLSVVLTVAITWEKELPLKSALNSTG